MFYSFFVELTLIYAFTDDEKVKQEMALNALENNIPVISAQIIKEFTNVALKHNLKTSIIENKLKEIMEVAEVIDEHSDCIFNALDIHERYKYSFYDSLVIATALYSNCKVLLSEDMQDGQIIDGKLKIINPFK